MPERIIVALEVVEVDHDHREFVLGSPRSFDEEIQPVPKQSARGKAGQGVVVGNMVDVFIGPFALGQIVGDSDKAGDGVLAVTQRSDDKLHRNSRSIFSNVRPLLLIHQPLLGRDTKNVMIWSDFGIELFGEFESALGDLLLIVQLDGAATEQVALLIPKHALSGGIDAGNETGLVGKDDAEGGTVDD